MDNLITFINTNLGINYSDYFSIPLGGTRNPINITEENLTDNIVQVIYGEPTITLYKMACSDEAEPYYLYRLYRKVDNYYNVCYVLIKRENISSCHLVAKYILDKLNNSHIHVHLYNKQNGFVVMNSVKKANHKPLESESCSELTKRLAKIMEYQKSGKVFNNNILLTGEPGTGKTRFVLDIAYNLGRDIYCMSLGDIEEYSEVEDCIILIEEIDKMLDANGNFAENMKVDNSTVLGFLDGVSRHSSTIIMMTCNNYELVMKNKILSRNGRISKTYHFSTITLEQTINLINGYYCDMTTDSVTDFYNRLPNKSSVTIAVLSAFIQNCILSDIAFADIDPDCVIDYISKSSKGYHMYS